MSAPLAVFDVDGTLVDSREAIQAAMTRGFGGAGLSPPPYADTRRIVGLSLPEALRTLAPALDAAALDRVADAYRTAWRDMHADPGFHEPLYPGAADLLEHLSAAGWRLAMATGKSRRGVETIVRMHHWEDVFASTHCADDGPGKPHPAMLEAALAAAGARPRDAVMIGDTAFDMHMARAAGVRAVGVTWGFHTAREVEAGGADHISSDFADLRAELGRFAASKRGATAPI
ncbi:MAG: HAD-IA family hydrolase [Caulobacteraceae bacterium]|nr:HAD-IA family hydrolase [Caulobacter sp.]